MISQDRPAGVTALSVFFAFGTLMSGITLLMLLFPASVLQPAWKLNPRAHVGFAAMGPRALLLMIVLCVACAITARGLWRCTGLGFWMALILLSLNLLGDTFNALLTHDRRTLIGLPIGGLMLLYLISQRRVFNR